MACIEKIYSVSALIGDDSCNANCSFCAGKYLRPQAEADNPLYWRNLEAAIKLSARYGGWSLSLTGSGEPTCSPFYVGKALEVYTKCANQGAFFPNINLFTNGIRFGDENFCKAYLPVWRKLGLTNIAVSVHATSEKDQAKVYGVPKYPLYSTIRENIEKYGIGVRATILLRKGEVDNPLEYKRCIEKLIYGAGIKNITSWAVGNPDGSRTEYTPSRWNMFRIRRWLSKNAKLCHGHVWGGGVYDYRQGNIVRITDYVTKHDPKKDYVRQLVVFQDGTVAYSWIREGALCLR